MICGLGRSKSRLAKAAGARPSGQMRDEKLHTVVARSTFGSEKPKNTSRSDTLEVELSKKCTPLWHEAHLEVKMYKAHHVRTTFRSCDVQKVHAVVARSTFRSQNVKHTTFRALLEVEMSKQCTPLWRQAHFEIKYTKKLSLGTLLGLATFKKCTPLWRERHFEVKSVKN